MAEKERVQKFKEFIELLGLGMKILEGLGAGSPASEVALKVGCVKSNITYWKNKLLRMGLITKQTTGFLKTYSLTPLGSKVLTGSEKLHESVVLEDFAMKFQVINFGRGSFLDWNKLGSPRNWQKMGVKLEGVRVVRTSRNLIIHPGKVRGFDVNELLADSGRIIERIKEFLERKWEIVLSDEGVPVHKPIFRFYSDEAKEDIKHCTAILHDKKTGQRMGSTDNSGDLPHEEFDGKELAMKRLRLPQTVENLERKVDELEETLSRMADAQEKTLDLLGKLFSSGKKGEPPELKFDYSS